MDDLICWCHVDDDVPHDIHQEALGLFAELDPGELQQPLQMPLDVDLGQA